MRHDGRCSECKNVIKAMFRRIYGDYPHTKDEAGMDVSADISDYKAKPYYKELKKIYNSLKAYRGYSDFVRAKKLPLCDLYVTRPRFIVETDESQHFSRARAIALKNYPKGLKTGFDTGLWIELCGRINAKDDSPAYRDEQRAWYDTLRDFLPLIKGFKPTVRIHLGDFKWCGLNPRDKRDVKLFRSAVFEKKTYSARIARVISSTGYRLTEKKVRSMLKKAAKQPASAGILMMPGGIAVFPMPGAKHSRKEMEGRISLLNQAAKKVLKRVLSRGLRRRLKKKFDFLTIGIDSARGQGLRAELVAVVDLKTGKTRFTGKSYPTTAEEEKLVRVNDLSSHFMRIGGKRVMVLGCHDLNMFSPRGDKTARGWRKKRKRLFKKEMKEFGPEIVLQHPHSAGSPRVWSHAWANLLKKEPGIAEYAAAFSFTGKRKNSKRTLASTATRGVIDLPL
ncbi:MAG TPA: hypothetical protein ENN43_03420 [bacterium]|nr:hypothetical protein [bacterium]